MAIYHLTAKIGSNADGKSAALKCAYITRTGDYSKKSGDCAYSASGNMPKWPKVNPQKDPSHYWKAADTYERDNGRLYRELEFALPRELSLEQQKELAHAFSEKVSTLKDGAKLPFTFAIHTDKANHNPHCHLMISERINDGIPRNASTWFKRTNMKEPKKGGAVKTQELNGKQWLEPVREMWATMANDALKMAGHAGVQIDHRSNTARGIAEAPSAHLGRASMQMMRRGVYSQRGPEILAQNIHSKTANRVSKLTGSGINFRAANMKVVTTAKEIMNAILHDLSRAWAIQREVAARERELIQMLHDMEAKAVEARMVTLRDLDRQLHHITTVEHSHRRRSPFEIPRTPKPP